jgi:hypothetical protein
MASALPVGDLSVGMRNDSHEASGAKEQRPERIPIDPEHRSYSRNVNGAGSLIRCFRTADGLNTTTRSGEIGILVPVFGVRRTRGPFLGFLVMAVFPCNFRISDQEEMRVAAQECEPGSRLRQ